MTIPIEILKIKEDLRDGYHILCRVHINNREFRMLVDTGSSMTLFNIDIVKDISQNKLENNNQDVISVGNSNLKSKYVVIDEMRIGNIILDNYKTLLIDIEHLNSFFRKNGEPLIDGIIGGDILNNYNAIIDYKNREILLS